MESKAGDGQVAGGSLKWEVKEVLTPGTLPWKSTSYECF